MLSEWSACTAAVSAGAQHPLIALVSASRQSTIIWNISRTLFHVWTGRLHAPRARKYHYTSSKVCCLLFVHCARVACCVWGFVKKWSVLSLSDSAPINIFVLHTSHFCNEFWHGRWCAGWLAAGWAAKTNNINVSNEPLSPPPRNHQHPIIVAITWGFIFGKLEFGLLIFLVLFTSILYSTSTLILTCHLSVYVWFT